MSRLKITKQYAQEFDYKCACADSHGFLRFITNPNAENISLLDLIAKVEDVIKFKPNKNKDNINLDEEKIFKCMDEFFCLYMPQKAEQVKSILNRTHSYFIDGNGVSHVNFISVKKEDNHSSNVGHCGKNSFLEFNVYIHNAIDDLRTTAHELSHALSSHHQHLIKLIRSNASMEEIEKYTQKRFEKDCIGEIESYITEKLFNRFLIKKGVFSQEDLRNYENVQQESLLNEINLIREERDIIKKLSCPVSFESLDKLVKNLQRQHKNRLLERIEKMHDENKNSPYMFRYVVGRIVSEQWMKEFDSATDKEKQFEMLDNFQKYLDKTHELNLDTACEKLTGHNFACLVKDYVNDSVNQNKNIDEKVL